MDLLNNLLETCTALTRRVENLEQDKIAQALEITKLKQKGRQEDSQAQAYHIDLEHVDKVLSMRDDEPEPAELQEVIEVVNIAKLMTEVVTTATTPITAVTIAAAPSAARRRKWVVIRDPEETTTPSIIIHSEPKSKDKGKGIMVQRKEKEDNVVLRYQALKRKPQTGAQARKNMMIYLKNMADFKMDYFKGMSYDAICLIFEKYFNSNVAFLEKSKEQLEEKESRALKRTNESLEEKATKKQKLDEEVDKLKKHLQIVPNDDDVYTEAIPLALKQSQKLENVKVMWSSHHNLYNHSDDLASREKISIDKVHFRADAEQCKCKLMLLDDAADIKLRLLEQSAVVGRSSTHTGTPATTCCQTSLKYGSEISESRGGDGGLSQLLDSAGATYVRYLSSHQRPRSRLSRPLEGGGPEGTDDCEETPPPLTKEQIEGHVQDLGIAKGKEVMDKDMRKPFKEAQRTPRTHRIIKFAGLEYKMPANIKLYDGTTDPEDHLSRFASAANSGEWLMRVWCRMFQQTLDGSARGWFKLETGFIMGVPVVMKISSFMDVVKSPELAKRFSIKVSATINEMIERLDDFVRSEEAYARTELPRGEVGETHHRASPNNYKGGRDTYPVNRIRDDRALYLPSRREYNHRVAPVPSLESLTKRPKEILAIEIQLCLPTPHPMLNPLRGRGLQGREAPQPAKVINVISVNSVKDQKRKRREVMELSMNVPISFPTISSDDVFEEPLIVKAKVEGYLARRVYVDAGSSIEVMFEHDFENFDSRIKAKLKETQTDLVRFAEEISKPLGKIELEVCFGNEGLCRRTSMKFIIVRAPSPYNIILGRPGLKPLRAIFSTIHSMMKFPTPRGVATLVTWTIIIAEYRRLEMKQMVKESSEGERGVAATEEVLINLLFPDQRVTIDGGLSEACRD
nr:reverse transcriptase domain-containing protein [Tanacetum cinerariifolium]